MLTRQRCKALACNRLHFSKQQAQLKKQRNHNQGCNASQKGVGTHPKNSYFEASSNSF